jgi:integrase/recombinase XerD
VRRRRGRKRAMGTRAPMTLPQGPNQRWSLDFVSDTLVCSRRMGASTATIKRDLTAISAVLKHAADEEWMEDINPTLAYRAKKSMVERRVPITLPTEHEIAMVKAEAPSRFADAMDFAIETGMREEEIFGLTYKQIAGGFITITGKRGKRRVIVLSGKAEQIIARQVQDIKSPFVFRHSGNSRWSSPASRFGDIRRRTAKAAQKAAQEFVGFRFHDLRHLYAVNFLRKRKGTLYELQMILGHDSVTTTEIYLEHLTPADRLTAIHGVTQKVARG